MLIAFVVSLMQATAPTTPTPQGSSPAAQEQRLSTTTETEPAPERQCRRIHATGSRLGGTIRCTHSESEEQASERIRSSMADEQQHNWHTQDPETGGGGN